MGHLIDDDENGSDQAYDVERNPLLTSKSDNLDDVPVYRVTHALRQEISNAVDTSLTWEQLKSPQLNSFLVRPLLSKCRSQGSRAIIFCLLTNCAQYLKEAEEDAARASVNNTRALACELLACKILKEFTPRELIDVLTFDFWPLKGDPRLIDRVPTRSQRISALELAIKGMCKKFLANPLVVQVLENIWKGNIVFYGASDKDAQFLPHRMRKAASTYDAREASIFKLSRLRVPRYRHWMQTISFAILLGLVIAVLMERNLDITPLEIVMVVYAIGFMLDEVVGLNDTGSTLFLANLWNAFDLLTLFFFVGFFVLRVYGLLYWQGTDMQFFAYDLLAVNTVFLTPRLFSALDHTRQFSQMLIAFQRMAIDLITSLIFILIFFAGFFLALSLAFARNLYTAKEVAFKLLQLIFGFSPAAWALLPEINWIGKILLLTFMVNSNYLVITILVSVLSTTFSNVITNAHEEHQYLFALNTILAVKSDALFFYQAPLNLIEWLLAPLCFVMPRPRWIRLNRYFIKFTHFPMLAAIYMFERFYLRPRAFVPQDLLLARTISLDHARGVSAGEAPRTVSGNFFARRHRRDSEAQQKNSAEILQQVFNNTQHARRQQGYGAVGPGVLDRKRTNDWVTRLPEHVFSPGGVTPSDGTPDQVRKTSYFDGGPPRRPGPGKRSNTTNVLARRYPATAQKPGRAIPREPRPLSVSGARSEPEDFASALGSPRSPTIQFAAMAAGRAGQRRATDESTPDAAARAIDIDSGDDEMDEEAIHAEDESESDSHVTRSGDSTDITTTPDNVRRPAAKSAGHTRSDSTQTIKARDRPLRALTAEGGNRRALYSARGSARNLSRSVPKAIHGPRAGAMQSSGSMRLSSEEQQQQQQQFGQYSSSIATQLAAHAGTDGPGDFVSRMLMNRVEGIETTVKAGHGRIERLEATVSDLVKELKRARKTTTTTAAAARRGGRSEDDGGVVSDKSK